MAAAARTSRTTGRYEGPKWSRRFEDSPEGMDAMMSHQEARRLPDDTDPDQIDDPAVREAFLDRLQSGEDDDTDTGSKRDRAAGRGDRHRANPSARRSRGRRRGSYAPSLTPPSRLSVADGTGFALGLVLYAVGLNYLRYGWPGVTGWISAKFINKPPDPPLELAASAKSQGGLFSDRFDTGRGAFGGGRNF